MRLLWNHKILKLDNDHSHTDHPEFATAGPEKYSTVRPPRDDLPLLSALTILQASINVRVRTIVQTTDTGSPIVDSIGQNHRPMR